MKNVSHHFRSTFARCQMRLEPRRDYAISSDAPKRTLSSRQYDQRKTNSLLYSGFSSLRDALQNLGSSIDRSLGELTTSVQGLTAVTAVGAWNASEELEALREQLAEDSATTQEHQRKTEQMLDNIQRRKKP